MAFSFAHCWNIAGIFNALRHDRSTGYNKDISFLEPKVFPIPFEGSMINHFSQSPAHAFTSKQLVLRFQPVRGFSKLNSRNPLLVYKVSMAWFMEIRLKTMSPRYANIDKCKIPVSKTQYSNKNESSYAFYQPSFYLAASQLKARERKSFIHVTKKKSARTVICEPTTNASLTLCVPPSAIALLSFSCIIVPYPSLAILPLIRTRSLARHNTGAVNTACRLVFKPALQI